MHILKYFVYFLAVMASMHLLLRKRIVGWFPLRKIIYRYLQCAGAAQIRTNKNDIRMNFNGSDCEIWNIKFNQEFNISSH